MSKFRIERGISHISRITRVKLQATIEESIGANLALLGEWSNNDKNYIVNELLRFALLQDTEFQAYKESKGSSCPKPRVFRSGNDHSTFTRLQAATKPACKFTAPDKLGRCSCRKHLYVREDRFRIVTGKRSWEAACEFDRQAVAHTSQRRQARLLELP